jgi:6-phosphogluconate dehydrogenase
MKIGYIGLGKMGHNMILNLLDHGYDIVGYDSNRECVKKSEEIGAEGAYSIEDLVEKTQGSDSRIVWIMTPHTVVDDVLSQLKPLLKKDDVVVDGGNSFYKDSLKRSEALAEKNIHLLDVGVSGGPESARSGAPLTIGGNKEIFKRLESLFKNISTKNGYAYVGSSGAGHFAKMIHNGIEYGMMQAIAEGFDVLKHADYNFSLREVLKTYAHGSVIESSLIEWLDKVFEKYGEDLEQVSGRAEQSGEGKWTIETASQMGIVTKVIEESFKARVMSQEKPNYQGKIISALRGEFGGHQVRESVQTIIKG